MKDLHWGEIHFSSSIIYEGNLPEVISHIIIATNKNIVQKNRYPTNPIFSLSSTAKNSR